MAQMTMVQAINDALSVMLEKDQNTLIFGEDVGNNGGVFRATQGLQAKFGEDRVFDTPLAESGILGLAYGLALEDFRPIPELQFYGFVYEAMDEIAGQIARARFKMGNTRNMPITIRAPFGGGVHTPEMHADSLEGLVAQTPGIRVVIPSNPYDAKGLLISSIKNNDPVMYLEHMKLYRSFKEEVPEGYYEVPLDKANIVKEGKDLTIISYGYMVRESLKASELLEKEGFSAEVLDLRTVSPLDMDTILNSVKKTGRVIIVQEAQKQSGIAANVAAEISEHAILWLNAPIMRVTASDTVYPFGQAENQWLPDYKNIIAKAKEIMEF